MSKEFQISAFLFIAFLSAGQLLAQDPTAAESAHREQVWDRYRIERQIQQATSPLPGVTITSPQPPIYIDEKSKQKIFKLQQVLFHPYPTSVSLSELEAIAANYIAMEKVSIHDLYSMIMEIDSLYDNRRLLGRAVLPVQDVESGIVTVQIIEGRIGKTKLVTKAQPVFDLGQGYRTTHRLFDRKFVQKQFRYSGNRSIHLQRLENEILRYNRTFQSQLAAELEPGDQAGETTLKLTRILPKPVSGGYYVDNSGRDTSGKIRNGMYLNLADVFGANESYFVSYDETEGTSALYMSGEIPVSRFGTFFDMSYYHGTPTTISGPWAELNINGTSRQYRPGFRQILMNTKTRRLDASIRYENYDSKTYFDVDLNYTEKHDSVTAGLEYSHRMKKSAVFAGLFVTGGHSTEGNLQTDLSMKYSEHDYCLMKMSLMKVWYPNEKVTYIVRGSGSAALSRMPQSQVFQIGGQATVRGTPEALMSGDSGYLVTMEGRYAVWSGSRMLRCRPMPRPCAPISKRFQRNMVEHSKVEVFGFLDHGGVFYRKHPSPMRQADFLSSIGLGLTANVGKHVSFMGGYGQPIFTAESHQMAYRNRLRHGNAFFNARVTF